MLAWNGKKKNVAGKEGIEKEKMKVRNKGRMCKGRRAAWKECKSGRKSRQVNKEK